jgi:hypothetical protein
MNSDQSKRKSTCLSSSSNSDSNETSSPVKPLFKRLDMGLTLEDLNNLRSSIRADFKSDLKSELKPIVLEVKAINNAINRLEKSDRANNIIVFGLKKESKESTAARIQIAKDLWKKMGLSSEVLIDNMYRLRKSSHTTVNPRLLLIKLVQNLDKQLILAKKQILPKQKIFINEDKSPLQQSQEKALRAHLINLKTEDASIWGSVRVNSLHVKKDGSIIARLTVVDGIVSHERSS